MSDSRLYNVENGMEYDESFHRKYYYSGDDLGAIYTVEDTSFRVWAPYAIGVDITFYKEGAGNNIIKSEPMMPSDNGTWYYKEIGEIHGWYYTYLVCNGGKEKEVVDPYAKATGSNGQRGMVIDLDRTNPEGFYEVKGPRLEQATDAIIYELHLRDISIAKDSGIECKGKYLGLCEFGTKNSYGDSTGLSHILDLGVTHVHLLPIFDYASIDEDNTLEVQYNWGYDPLNYNVPEGSYATNAKEGMIRVRELKELIHCLHQNGIGVIMDVVYNHTYHTEDSNLNKIVPDYYYRKRDGEFSNGSACGNETASEHPMMRKYMVDSISYWAKEYNLDGFRFDLMALHDIKTMNEIREAIDKIHPNLLMYGEGWTGGESPLSIEDRALKVNVSKLDRIAVFSDDIRDGIKGSVFEEKETGYVSGAKNLSDTIRLGIVGGTEHEGVKYSNGKYSKEPYAIHPYQVINYASAHDNLTLWDKLSTSNAKDSEKDRIKMNQLSIGIVLTSMGIPFFQAGEEFLRSKGKEDGTFDENSYKSSDAVNGIRWDRKTEYKEVYEYYKGMLGLRRSHSGLRMSRSEEVNDNLRFIPCDDSNVIAYVIDNDIKIMDNQEIEKGMLCVIHNSNPYSVNVTTPVTSRFSLTDRISTSEGFSSILGLPPLEGWEVYCYSGVASEIPLTTILENELHVEAISTTIAYRKYPLL